MPTRLARVSAIGAAAIALGAVAGQLAGTPTALSGGGLPSARPSGDDHDAALPTWAQIIDAPTWAQRLLPATLRETGLYADWKSARVSTDARSFSPQYPLWTDGATKRRWIYLPGPIDTSDPDNWQFPVGTRFWKEFSFGARVETRFMIRARDGWKFATYAWTPDASHAIRASSAGATRSGGAGWRDLDIASDKSRTPPAPGVRDGAISTSLRTNLGQTHRIPSAADCIACHENGTSPVLGFAALQLSGDRDPNAAHREPAGDIDLAWLAARGLVGDRYDVRSSRPRIEGSASQRAALGYLHGNCSGCHRADGPLAGLGMVLSHDGAVRTTAGVPSKYGAPAVRVVPGDPANSVLLARMKSRHSAAQMPPIGTVLVDEEAIRLVADWIDQLAPITTRGDGR